MSKNPRSHKPVRLARETMYRSAWVHVHRDRVRLPGGRLVPRHHFLEFSKKGVGVLVQDGRGRVLLVLSARYVTGTLGWEIPAGNSEKGESLAGTARREVLEETGYRTGALKKLYRFHPMNGIADAQFYIFTTTAGKLMGTADANEVRAVRWFTRSEIRGLIARRKILDGFSLAALLFYLEKRVAAKMA